MKFTTLLTNIVTVGGEYRLQKNKEEYERVSALYKSYYEDMKYIEMKYSELEEKIREYAETIKKIFKEFPLEETFGDNLKQESLMNPTRYKINKSSKLSNIEVATVLGSSAVLPVAAYYLVGAFGSASTGTAIASLPLVAQSGTILSWFGGGSLATGGLGIIGGSLVLPGLMLLPLSYFSVKKHKMASEYSEKIKQIKNVLDHGLNQEQIEEEKNKVEEKIIDLQKLKENFEADLYDLCNTFAEKIWELIKNQDKGRLLTFEKDELEN